MSDSEEEPQLSAFALAALQEFYKEQQEESQKEEAALTSGDVTGFTPKEDWVSIYENMNNTIDCYIT